MLILSSCLLLLSKRVQRQALHYYITVKRSAELYFWLELLSFNYCNCYCHYDHNDYYTIIVQEIAFIYTYKKVYIHQHIIKCIISIFIQCFSFYHLLVNLSSFLILNYSNELHIVFDLSRLF